MPSKASDLLSRLSVGWVSLNQLSKILGISYPTVQRLREQGRIKVIPIGGVYRVYATEIRRILDEGTDRIVAPSSEEQKQLKIEYEPYQGDDEDE